MIEFKNLFLLKERVQIPSIKWKKGLDEEELSKAQQYLGLHFASNVVLKIMSQFKRHPDSIQYYKAQDIFRAINMEPESIEVKAVRKKLKQIQRGDIQNPIMLAVHDGKVYMAHGYHRLSAMFWIKRNIDVAVVIAYV